ncbi:unnamed protein product, partial [Choristocarpus tenellus]
FINKQINVLLLDHEGDRLGKSARPVMVPYSSRVLKGLKMTVAWPLFLLGFREESETVSVKFFDFYQVRAGVGDWITIPSLPCRWR